MRSPRLPRSNGIKTQNDENSKWKLVKTKGQVISKCLLGVIISTKKTNEIFLRISALASKKSSNQKTLLYKYVK